MGGRVAQLLVKLFALSDEVWRVGRGPGEQERRIDVQDAGKCRPLIVFAGIRAKVGFFRRAGIRAKTVKARYQHNPATSESRAWNSGWARKLATWNAPTE